MRAVLFCVCVALIVTSVGVGLGHADQRSAVVVIDSGTEDIFIESLVRTNAETELKNKGYVIVEGVAVGGDTPTKLLACAGDMPCSVAVLQGITAKFVVFISLRSDAASESTNFKIIVRNYEVSTGKVLARTMRRCPECNEEVDLAGFTAQLIIELLQESDSQRDPPNDRPRASPAPPEPTPPATVVTGTIPIPTGVGNTGSNGANPVDGPSRSLSLVKYAGLGVGLAAIATGTYLVLIDGPVIEDGVRQQEANDTLVGGFVSLGLGVAAVGLSAWLWARDGDSAANSGAHIVPTQDGASFVWSGGF